MTSSAPASIPVLNGCTDLNKQLGQPDLFVLFTNTVSHKMVKTALDEAKRSNAKVVRSHTSSGAALTEILTQEAGAAV